MPLQFHAQQLNEVIQALHDNKKYKEMVIYVESCESGSLFHGLLPSNINGITILYYLFTTLNSNKEY